MITGKQFKLKSLPSRCEPNSIYYIKPTPTSKITIYITDTIGIPSELNLSTAGIDDVINTDNYLEITGTDVKTVNLKTNVKDIIDNAITEETDPIFQSSEASLFVTGDKDNLDNQSGVNTGDETTESIQIKRPLKTINNQSLEGTGNIDIEQSTIPSLDDVLSIGNYSEKPATVGDFKAKSFQIGDNLVPEISGGLFNIQKNADGTISVVLDSVSHNDSDNFGRLTATLSNEDGIIFRHLDNDNNQGVIATIRKDGIIFSLINSFLKVYKDGSDRDILISGIAQINDIFGLGLALNNKADLVEGKVPAAQSQPSTMVMNNSTYVITFTDATGAIQTIDLPLESLFQDANYDETTKSLIVTLQDGTTKTIPLSDLVDLPEIVLSTTNPAVTPTSGQKVYFNTSLGKVWFNISGAWVFAGNLISDSEKANITTAYDHSQATGNPHGTTATDVGALNLDGSNANSNINIGEFQIKAGQVELDQTPTQPFGVGMIRWNDTDGTAEIRLKGNNVTLQIGQELVKRVVNKSGANLLESQYKVVKIIGATGQRLSIDLAQANSELNSETTIGIVTENINNNQEGFITYSGEVNAINTTGSLQGETWADGDVLYLSPSVAGGITKIKPTAPNHVIIVGYVEYSHAVNGKIFVKIDNGYELEELHNVTSTNYTTPIDTDSLLTFDVTNSLWKRLTWANIKANLKTYFDSIYTTSSAVASQITTALVGYATQAWVTSQGYLTSINSSQVTTALGYTPISDLQIRRKGITLFDDMTSNAGGVSPFTKNTFNSGTIAVSTTFTEDTPSVVSVSSSSGSTNGGGNISMINTTSARPLAFREGYQFDTIINLPAVVNNVIVRCGILTGTTNLTQPTDGAYFEITGASLVGRTSNNSVRSSTSDYTLSANTWYHLRVFINSMSLVTFYVYDINGTLLTILTLNTNIPTLATGVQPILIVHNTTAEVRTLINIDYIAISYPPMNRGALT